MTMAEHQRRTLPVVIALAVALASCASVKPADVASIEDTDESRVARCTYLKEVSSRVGWWYGMLGNVSGTYAQEGLDNARLEALSEAKKLGATHVVWLGGAQGSARASAKAYRCK